jgi:WD40 repeat protein
MGRLLIVGHDVTPFWRIYDTADWTLTDDALTFHNAVIGSQVQGASINPAGTLLAFGTSLTPFLNVVSIADGADVTVTSGKPNGNANGTAFSPDGSKLAVAGAFTGYLFVYNTADWTKQTIASPPASNGLGVAFSPDGTKLAVGYASAPYLTVYNVADWSAVTLTGGDPPGAAYQPHWSPDGTKLAVMGATSPYLTVYDTSDWSKITLTGGNPAGSGQYACRFSPDGTKLAVGHSTTPFLTVYNVADWSKITLTGGNPPTTVYSLGWSYDGALLAVASSLSPYVTIYNVADWSKLANPATLPAGAGKCALFTDGWQTKAIATSVGHTVLDDTASPAVRTVRVVDRATGRLLVTKTSDAGGDYAVKLLTAAEKQVVFLDDAAGTLYNDLVHRVLPA